MRAILCIRPKTFPRIELWNAKQTESGSNDLDFNLETVHVVASLPFSVYSGSNSLLHFLTSLWCWCRVRQRGKCLGQRMRKYENDGHASFSVTLDGPTSQSFCQSSFPLFFSPLCILINASDSHEKEDTWVTPLVSWSYKGKTSPVSDFRCISLFPPSSLTVFCTRLQQNDLFLSVYLHLPTLFVSLPGPNDSLCLSCLIPCYVSSSWSWLSILMSWTWMSVHPIPTPPLRDHKKSKTIMAELLQAFLWFALCILCTHMTMIRIATTLGFCTV